MSHNFQAALDQCLIWLREGESIETCLLRYPEHADRLCPLLETAIQVGRVRIPVPEPGARAAGRQQMLAALDRKRERSARAHPLVRLLRQVLWFLVPGRPGRVHPAWQTVAAFLLVAFLSSGGATLAASTKSLPGDRLYPLKLASQQTLLNMTFDPDQLRARADRFAVQRRLDVQTAIHEQRHAYVEFQGTLEQAEGGLWLISGLPVALQATTSVEGQPVVGATVRVQADLPGDGQVVARWLGIEPETDEYSTDRTMDTTTPTKSDTVPVTTTREQRRTATPSSTPTLTSTPLPEPTSLETKVPPSPEVTKTPKPQTQPPTATGSPEDSETPKPSTHTSTPGHNGSPDEGESPEPDLTPGHTGSPDDRETEEPAVTPDPDHDEDQEPPSNHEGEDEEKNKGEDEDKDEDGDKPESAGTGYGNQPPRMGHTLPTESPEGQSESR